MSDEDIMLITVRISHATWPNMKPGSVEATDEGCTCPEDQPSPPMYVFASDCPIHKLELVPCH